MIKCDNGVKLVDFCNDLAPVTENGIDSAVPKSIDDIAHQVRYMLMDELGVDPTTAESIMKTGNVQYGVNIPGLGKVNILVIREYIIIIPDINRLSRYWDDTIQFRITRDMMIDEIVSEMDATTISAKIKEILSEKYMTNKYLTPDQKLFKMFKLYKGELKRGFTPLYYTLLGWEDKHKHDPFISKYGMNDDGFLRR